MSPSIFAIIGGGLTGTAMLHQFVHELRASGNSFRPTSMKIYIIERHPEFGPGFPHNDRYMMPIHLINMCAADMGIVSENSGDFESWAAHQADALFKHPKGRSDPLEPSNSEIDSCTHYPRTLMGEYLKARFKEAVRIAESMGIAVGLYSQHEAIDMNETRAAVKISIRDLRSGTISGLSVHRALLATGHWCSKGHASRFISSPWPARTLLEKIPSGSDVALLGTSLTAVDTVLTLTADGSFDLTKTGGLVYHPSEHPRQITLYSRRGLLPLVRGRVGPYRNRVLSPEKLKTLLLEKGRLSLDALFRGLDDELKAAYGRPFHWEEIIHPSGNVQERLQSAIELAESGDGPHGDIRWQTVLQQLFPMVRELYLALPRGERARFERHYSTPFFIHAAPMPLKNARKLLALMKAGILEVVGAGTSFQHHADHCRENVTISYQTPDGKRKRNIHDYLVDARGQGRAYGTNPDPLAVRLLRSKTVMIEPALHQPCKTRTTSFRGETHSKAASASRSSGSLWVDPFTHRVKRIAPNGEVEISKRIYAVGAMTRGQIIDASTAHGSAVSTATIARDWTRQVSHAASPA